MLKKNQIITSKILRFGAFGEGIAEVEGLPVFIPYAIEGETVEFKILKVLKTHAFGKVLKIIEKSPERQDVPCPVFNRCGGCNMLHISYEKQLKIKHDQVVGCIKKYANADIKVHDVIGSEENLFYRNKAQYPIKDGLCGFYASRSHDIINMDKCYMQNPLDEEIIKTVKEYVFMTNAKIKNIYTRYGKNEAMVVLVSEKKSIPKSEILVENLRKISDKIVSVILNINPEKTNVILGKENVVLWGKDKINTNIGNIKFEISPNSFFQINPKQTEVLYQKAKDIANFKKTDNIADLYCGIGSIGLFMADSVNSVTGVEIVPDAVKDAEKNKNLNNIKNAEFYQGEAENIMPELIKEKHFDAVIIDPPRKGCDEKLIDCLNELKVPKIIYISCNPATLARDIKLLSKSYTAKEIYPVDMFPNTVHVESVVLLERTDSTAI